MKPDKLTQILLTVLTCGIFILFAIAGLIHLEQKRHLKNSLAQSKQESELRTSSQEPLQGARALEAGEVQAMQEHAAMVSTESHAPTLPQQYNPPLVSLSVQQGGRFSELPSLTSKWRWKVDDRGDISLRGKLVKITLVVNNTEYMLKEFTGQTTLSKTVVTLEHPFSLRNKTVQCILKTDRYINYKGVPEFDLQ